MPPGRGHGVVASRRGLMVLKLSFQGLHGCQVRTKAGAPSPPELLTCVAPWIAACRRGVQITADAHLIGLALLERGIKAARAVHWLESTVA